MSASDRPVWLLALGHRDPAPELSLGDGRTLKLAQVYKHDFFAHTARYGSGGDAVVVKRSRRGLATGWLGRLVTWHERRVFRRLAGLPGIPDVVEHPEPATLVHEHLPGRALAWGDHPPDGFLEALEDLVTRVHARGVAVVDLEKPGNVLLADDNTPALFDFQLAFAWPRILGGGLPPFTWILRTLQHGDRYHLQKLRRRLRPDTMTPEEREASRQKPGPVRFITQLIDPFRRLRRNYLARIDDRRDPGERGRVSR